MSVTRVESHAYVLYIYIFISLVMMIQKDVNENVLYVTCHYHPVAQFLLNESFHDL